MGIFIRTAGAVLTGAHAQVVDVQVALAEPSEESEPSFRLVGLPDSALREGRERIRSAVEHGGWRWHRAPITVNLAPAAARKEGAGLDLPIAVGVLAGMRACPPESVSGCLFVGELTLDGMVRPVRGILAASEAARRAGLKTAFVPRAHAAEAAAVGGLDVHAVDTLRELVDHLAGREQLPLHVESAWTPLGGGAEPSAVRGQPLALRAAWIAAAGGHNLLLSGPPGCGKTLLAREIAGLMPPFSRAEALESSRMHSIAGLLHDGLLRRRPFRAPHHTTSMAGLVGGGSMPRPGEISLAHGGVLFLDELVEFPRPTLEALRQPLEDGHLTLSRAAGTVSFPARVLLVAACNPCPCGWFGVGDRCRCARTARERYAGRLSGPLRDRFDLQIALKPVDPERLVAAAEEAPYRPAAMAEARRRQTGRGAGRGGDGVAWNARIASADLPEAAAPSAAARAHLVRYARVRGLSGRGLHRVLRVARTVADLRAADSVEVGDVDLALHLRSS